MILDNQGLATLRDEGGLHQKAHKNLEKLLPKR